MSRVSPEVLAEKKRVVLEALGSGKTVKQSVALAGRSIQTYEKWRKDDAAFRAEADAQRARAKAGVAAQKKAGYAVPVEGNDDVVPVGRRDISFSDWRMEYLGYETYPHQDILYKAAEGILTEDDPYFLPGGALEGCEFTLREPNRVIINIPPFHGKTQTLTIDWVNYLICMDPNIRIALVSKNADMARKQLYQIRSRLTSNLFAKIQAAYAPPGGWRPEAGQGAFTQNVLYVAGRTVDHKDPTVEALGIGKSIYGSRYDVILMDDCITGDNVMQFEKHINWIETEVENRVLEGQIVIIGTRLAPMDLYSELPKDERYGGESPWSYLRMPMVLRFDDDPNKWKTLWPYANQKPDRKSKLDPETGLYPTLGHPLRAARTRNQKPPGVWSLVYMQQGFNPDAVFKEKCVLGSVDRRRKPGPLTHGALGHPSGGGEGMYTIGSIDPAGTGDTFVIVGKVDRQTNKRWIENAWCLNNASPATITNLMKSATEEYGVNQWVIEAAVWGTWVIHDPVLRPWMATRGVDLTPHVTLRNKQDPDFGVASMAPLFGSLRRINDEAGREVHEGDNLIELPDNSVNPGVKALIEQLLNWKPGYRGKDLRMDGPMALWFFEMKARNILIPQNSSSFQTHTAASKFTPKRLVKQRASYPPQLVTRMGTYGAR